MEHITDVPELLRRIFMQLFSGRDGLRLVFAIRIACLFLGLIMYVLSPFDIIPEAAFGLLGYVDDILVVFLLVIYATMIYRQAVINNASSTTAGS
jgi:RING finger protein 170